MVCDHPFWGRFIVETHGRASLLNYRPPIGYPALPELLRQPFRADEFAFGCDAGEPIEGARDGCLFPYVLYVPVYEPHLDFGEARASVEHLFVARINQCCGGQLRCLCEAGAFPEHFGVTSFSQ